MSKKIELFMSIALLCCAVFLARESAIFVRSLQTSHSDSSGPLLQTEHLDSTESSESSPFCIVIDAGHGGVDPGKVGVDNVLEKDINLSIALLLKDALEKEGITIALTREEDVDLSEGASNFKSADMKNRCKLITDAAPIFTISIHQNSYPSANVTGAQVFYYTESEEGKSLATILQNSLIKNVDPSNRRQPKANDSYYLLKKTPTPTVIVECGFLSSPVETALLCTEEYQRKIVNAIRLGVLEYLEANDYL